MKNKFYLYFLLAGFSGLAIAWIDSQPTWDDTGITILLILVVSTLFGFLAFKRPWLIALAVSLWIPLWAILRTQNYGMLSATIPGFCGAYAGYNIRYLLSKK